jgi:hypothetical protein
LRLNVAALYSSFILAVFTGTTTLVSTANTEHFATLASSLLQAIWCLRYPTSVTISHSVSTQMAIYLWDCL